MRRVLPVFIATLVAAHALAAPQSLRMWPAPPSCGLGTGGTARIVPAPGPPPIPDSEVVSGRRDIRRAWLGTPTDRYAHAALGSRTHGASLHAVVVTAAGDRSLTLELADDRVFEDRLLRLEDLDGDGRDEIIVVEAHAHLGAALVVIGIEGTAAAPRLAERARSPHVGAMRWLNPVGTADFDGDGKLEIVSVTTPHIGGVLTLYRYDPPHLVPLAQEANVSNHRMGAVEQRLATIVTAPGEPPLVLVPDQSRRAVRLLRWDKDAAWLAVGTSSPLPSAAARIVPHPGGACLQLENGDWLVVSGRAPVRRAGSRHH